MMAFSPTRHRSPHGDASPAGGRILPVPNLRRGVFFWIVRAFRAAIRTEVDRAMADRRAALRTRPVEDTELIAIGVALGQCGLNLRHAEVVPFPVPANDHSDTSPPAA